MTQKCLELNFIRSTNSHNKHKSPKVSKRDHNQLKHRLTRLEEKIDKLVNMFAKLNVKVNYLEAEKKELDKCKLHQRLLTMETGKIYTEEFENIPLKKKSKCNIAKWLINNCCLLKILKKK